MAVVNNNVPYKQAYTLLNAVKKQIVGTDNIANADATNFVSVAQEVLRVGYDPILHAISQVMDDKTIYAVRPYKSRFNILTVNEQEWGNATRKISYVSADAVADGSGVDGSTISSFGVHTVQHPIPVETQIFDGQVWERFVTGTRKQLNSAFSSAEGFSRFWAGVLTDITNQIELDHQSASEMCALHLIGMSAQNSAQCIHLLTEYDTAIGNVGEGATATTWASLLADGDKLRAFAGWASARIKQVAGQMSVPNTIYHANSTKGKIQRNTPASEMRYLWYENFIDVIDSMGKAGLYHDDYIKLGKGEKVAYWQSMQSPQSINVKVNQYDDQQGVVKTAKVNFVSNTLVACIFDSRCAGRTVIDNWTSATPMDAEKGMFNLYWHYRERYFNDPTENCVCFFLD